MNAPTTETTSTTAPDPQQLEAFLEGVLDDIKGHQAVLMCSLGEHLGLFQALADGPASSSELATRASVDDRYVHEWLSGMTAAGYITYDPTNRTFHLTPEQAEVLAGGEGPVALGGLFYETPGMYHVFDAVKHAFRSGGGVPLGAYPVHWWDGMERFTATWFDNFLVQEWIPAADGIDARLRAGAHVADVGCGRGRALVRILENYPQVTAVGYDLSETQLQGARRHADTAGVADRVRFVQRDAAQGLDDTFDVITTFDAAHDLADPNAVFTSIREALKAGGSYLLLDFKVADRLEDNIGRNPTMFYGWSLFYCLTTALAQDGEGLGTCGLPENEVRARCEKAGFSSVEVVPFDNPFNVLYQAKA